MIQYDRRHHFNYQQGVLPERLDLYEEHLVIVDCSPFFILQRGFLINHLHSIICLSCMSIPFPSSEDSYAPRVFDRLGHEQTVASISLCITSSSLSAAENSLSNGGRVDFLMQKYPG